jgi:hypothetical protein
MQIDPKHPHFLVRVAEAVVNLELDPHYYQIASNPHHKPVQILQK